MATKKQLQRRATMRPSARRDLIVDVMRSYGKPISPNELALVTGHTLGTTAYHVKTLLAAGLVRLANEDRVRGAVEHFYVLVPTGEDEPMPFVDRIQAFAVLCDGVAVAGSDGEPRLAVLDHQAREALGKILAGVRPEVQRIVRESTVRSDGDR